jgi:hypothetical protein
MAVAIPPKVSKIVDVFVALAAAVVIWGALRKILHAPDADMWLKIGLTTEAVVFLVYGYPVSKISCCRHMGTVRKWQLPHLAMCLARWTTPCPKPILLRLT